jgi:hypothetical protein
VVVQLHPRVGKGGDEEAKMLYLWGPGLVAEVDYRRANLGKVGVAPRGWWRACFAVALGGPDLYAGRDLRAAHAHLAITERHFDAVATHLATTLTDLGVPDEFNQVITARVDSLRPQIVAAVMAEAG